MFFTSIQKLIEKLIFNRFKKKNVFIFRRKKNMYSQTDDRLEWHIPATGKQIIY